MQDRCDVAVVGAGPVGLLLACMLAQRGIAVQVLERTSERRSDSRAIGIHPPGLACLAQVGLSESLIARGVRVTRGRALVGRHTLGTISFASLPPPYPFVLSVPQSETERQLEQRLTQLAPLALKRGRNVTSAQMCDSHLELQVDSPQGQETLRAPYVVACDGKHSTLRKAFNIPYPGAPYARSFVMGDFADHTPYETDAVVFLDLQGLVECFPLPEGRRRWVSAVGRARGDLSAEGLCTLIRTRTGHAPRAHSVTMLSSFAAERYQAAQLVRGRLVLAGDAAHVVSPIGGQGMNLGWLDALALSVTLEVCLREPHAAKALLRRYDQERRKAAGAAARRAEWFMALGGERSCTRARDTLLRTLLRPRLAPYAARLFTMRGL